MFINLLAEKAKKRRKENESTG